MKDQLKIILKDELEAMTSLITVLEVQHRLLVEQSVYELEKITKDIEECSKELAMCESKRRSLVGRESMRAIVDGLKDVEVERIYDEVVKAVNALYVQKETNDMLLKQSLSFTNSMLAMVSPKKENLTYNGYGKIKK